MPPRIEAVTSTLMLQAPTPGLRIVNFRTFTGVAEAPQAHRPTQSRCSMGPSPIPGMPLKPL